MAISFLHFNPISCVFLLKALIALAVAGSLTIFNPVSRFAGPC